MKKNLKSIFLVVMIFLGINNVMAANQLTSFKLRLENSENIKSLENNEGYEYLNIYTSVNDNNEDVLHLDLRIDGEIYQTEYTFNNENSVMRYSKVGSKYYDDYYNNELLNYFAEEYNYNIEKLYTYIYTNDDLTLSKDGIEYSLGEMYTEEEMQQMIKEWEEYWSSLTEEGKNEMIGAGFANPEVFTELKLDFKNGLKKYDESLIPYYYFFEESQEFDISKDKNFMFEIDADFELFDKVYVDGKELEESNYSAKAGSTIITFNNEYSKKLAEGSHAIKVTFTDGEFAESTFTIKNTAPLENNNVENPKTGVVLSYGILMLILIISSIVYFLIRKKSKFLRHN